jgi:Ni,Fe-hydrogenase maturation factor
MANQVRELIEQSVKAYVEFIQRYKYKNKDYPTPQDIIMREYDAETPFEDNFISLQLAISGNKIVFSDPTETVQKELEDVIDNIVTQSSNLPRPENTIARSDKMHLWDVQIDDKLVTDAKFEISETLKENIDVIELALEVYNDYLFILKEKERIEEFLKKEPFDKNQFQAEIDKYMETITKIKDEMPFEIRCNMFLIVCSDINNTLCENCEELISMILFKT